MGYYIETSGRSGKAKAIADQHNGLLVDQATAKKFMDDKTKAVIVVVDNILFEAAAFAYSMGEFLEFHSPQDHRLKTYVVIDRAKAKKLTGYTGD
jgi:acyl-coenzyme A synthetase/AMP-(fatty) acid ligase